MSNDGFGGGKGFDEDKLRAMQELLGRYANQQEQAVQLPCPFCQGRLDRNDIGSVRCILCNKIYFCQTLIESQGLQIDLEF